MESRFVIKRLEESGTCTEFYQCDLKGGWMWGTSIHEAYEFSYEMAKLVASLMLRADRLQMQTYDVPIYSIVQVNNYEELIR